MRTVLSVVGAIVIFAILGTLIYFGGVPLVAFLPGLYVVLLSAAFGLLAWGFKPYFTKDVSLKIEKPRIEIHNLGTKHEFKNLVFDVKNDGKLEAMDCRIRVKVKEIWDDAQEIVNPNLPISIDRGVFNLIPDGEKTIFFGQITREHPTTCELYTEGLDAHLREFSKLTEGIYRLEIRFLGKNFVDRKIHLLRLNLSSWEDIGIALDC